MKLHGVLLRVMYFHIMAVSPRLVECAIGVLLEAMGELVELLKHLLEM